jgi:hypothetical protein
MSIGVPPVAISEREPECSDAGSKTGCVGLIAALAAIFVAIGPNPVSPANSDLLADRYLAAIVGNRVWSQFTLTLDYPHTTMVLARNPAVN